MWSLPDFGIKSMVAHLISLTLIGAPLYHYLTTKGKGESVPWKHSKIMQYIHHRLVFSKLFIVSKQINKTKFHFEDSCNLIPLTTAGLWTLHLPFIITQFIAFVNFSSFIINSEKNSFICLWGNTFHVSPTKTRKDTV